MQDKIRGVYYEVGASDPESSKNAGVEFFIRNLSKIFSSGGVTVFFSTFESKLMHRINVTVIINWGLFMFCIHLYMWLH